MVRTVRRTMLRSQLACNELQASARTCGRSAAGQHDAKCRLKSVDFNHPSQGNSTNYYIILDPRIKAAHPTSQQTDKFPPKRVRYRHGHPFLFFVLPHPQNSPLCSQPTKGNVRQNVPKTCWVKLFGPRIQLRRSSTNKPNWVREAKVRPFKNQLW